MIKARIASVFFCSSKRENGKAAGELFRSQFTQSFAARSDRNTASCAGWNAKHGCYLHNMNRDNGKEDNDNAAA